MRSTPTAILASALALLCLARVAGAGDPPGDWELPTAQEDLTKALTDVAKQFGPDAVMMQAYLINEAVRNGSILEAEVGKPSLDERGGRKYLSFTVDTGIVFNDRTVTASDRPVRVWRDILERCLRRYATFDVPADGLAVTVRYHHREYVDEWDLRSQLPEAQGEAETLAFYLSVADAIQLMEKRLSPQELIDRSSVLRNGQPFDLRLP